MTLAEVQAYQRGCADVAAVAAGAADVLQRRAARMPLRYERAIAALEAVIEGAAFLGAMVGEAKAPPLPAGGGPST